MKFTGVMRITFFIFGVVLPNFRLVALI